MKSANLKIRPSWQRIGNIKSVNSADLESTLRKTSLMFKRKITVVVALCSRTTTQFRLRCSTYLMIWNNKGHLRGYPADLITAKESFNQNWPACVMFHQHQTHKSRTFMRSLRTLNTQVIHFIQAPKRIPWSLISGLSKILVVPLSLSSLLQSLHILVNSMILTTVE